MAGQFPDDDAAANGFGRRHLHKHEARALYEAGYPTPPDMHVPGASGGQASWHLSTGGVPVPPPPEGAERDYAIEEVIAGLTPVQVADPRWQPDNFAFWTQYFLRRHEEELRDRGRNGPVEGRVNSKGRKRWWSAPGRNLAFVLDYIAAGNEPRLTMPLRTASWLPRRMGAASSFSSESSDACSAPPAVRQHVTPPPILNSSSCRTNPWWISFSPALR